MDRVEEPEVDFIDEGQTLAVLVEFPGVREEELDVQVNGDVLSLSAEFGQDEPRPRYYRELLLPFAVETHSIQRTFHNGVLELELRRASSSPGSERSRRERR